MGAVAAGVLAAIVGGALAQTPEARSEQRVIVSTPDGPVAISVGGDGAGGVHERVGYYQFQRDGQKIELSLRNGRVASAKVNGEEVPGERVKLEGGTLTIADEQGETVFTHTFESSDAGLVTDRARWYGRAATGELPMMRRLIRGQAPDAPVATTALQPAPAVMLGLHMVDAPDVLCGHLGIESRRAVLVASVSKGLPVDLAGLKPYDLIVGMDGVAPEKGLAVQDIRDRMAKANPGDVIAFEVMHRGQRRSVPVTLAKYDADSLRKADREAMAALPSAGSEPDAMTFWSGGRGGSGSGAAAPIAVAPNVWAMQIDPFGGADPGVMNEQVERAIREAIERMEAARARSGLAGGEIEQMREQMLRMERMMQRLMEQQGGAAVPPSPPPSTPPAPAGSPSAPRVPEKSS